jgi:succinate dehydrogenase hydrophobic anchor subunit
VDTTVEFVTHIAVLVFYVAALVVGIHAHYSTNMWVRKVATAAIIIASLAWLSFYLFAVPLPTNGDVPVKSPAVLWLRISQYVNAVALIIMALTIRLSEKYGLRYVLPNGDD